MASVLHTLDTVTAGSRIAKRAASVGKQLGPQTSSTAVSGFDNFLQSNAELPANEPKDGVGTVIGAALGGVVWSDHRVLGLIGGASIGRNVPALLKAETRRAALCNLAQTGTGIAGSLALKSSPVTGFVAGWLAGGAVLYYTHARE